MDSNYDFVEIYMVDICIYMFKCHLVFEKVFVMVEVFKCCILTELNLLIHFGSDLK